VWGIVLTWAVGGVVAFEGWRVLTRTVHGEAEARVRDAVRVAVDGEHGSWIAFSFTIPNALPGALPPAGVPTHAGTAMG
jgi:hypothetical protein